MTKTDQHEDECGCCACLATVIDGLSWPGLTGDGDASAFVDRCAAAKGQVATSPQSVDLDLHAAAYFERRKDRPEWL